MLIVEENFTKTLKRAKRKTFLLELTKNPNKYNSRFEFYYDIGRNEAGLRADIPSKIWVLGKEKIVKVKISRNAMFFIVELILGVLNKRKEKFSLLIKEGGKKAWEIPCNFDKDLSLSMIVQEVARYQRLLKPMQRANPVQALVEALPQ